MIYDTKNIITWFLMSLEIIPIKETLIWLHKNRGIYLPILENKVIHNIVTMYHFFLLYVRNWFFLYSSKNSAFQIYKTSNYMFIGFLWVDHEWWQCWTSWMILQLLSLFFSHTTYRWNELGSVKMSYRQVDKNDLLDSTLEHVATCVGKRYLLYLPHVHFVA